MTPAEQRFSMAPKSTAAGVADLQKSLPNCGISTK